MKVGMIVLIFAVATVTGFVLLFRGVNAAAAPARQAAESYVMALESGNVEAAYGLMCGDTRRIYTLEMFRRDVAEQPKIRSHKVIGNSINIADGVTFATVEMRLMLDDGFDDRHRFTMVEEAGAWKVCD